MTILKSTMDTSNVPVVAFNSEKDGLNRTPQPREMKDKSEPEALYAGK
ncbi:hypothetical protein [Streptosporangium minutum]|nr:hypothetical protein [Streptosporangium minutum]